MLNIFIENSFKDSPVAQDILNGIYQEARKKRISVREINSVSELIGQNGLQYVVLVALKPSWLYPNLSICQEYNIHPIVLSNLTDIGFLGEYSYVYAGMQNSMNFLHNFFKNNNKERTALYGINANSLDAINCVQYFLQYAKSKPDDFIYHDNSLDDCFQTFYSKIEQYDSVLCLSDFAAISLINKLKERNFDLKSLYIVCISTSDLSKFTRTPITSLYMDMKKIGESAIFIYETLKKQKHFISLNINVDWSFVLSDTTSVVDSKSIPNRNHKNFNKNNNVDLYSNMLFEEELDSHKEDAELNEMIGIELMLKKCYDIDFDIITKILEGKSYMDIADLCYISLNTVKYHTNKMMALCGVTKKSDFTNLLSKYIDIEKISDESKRLI